MNVAIEPARPDGRIPDLQTSAPPSSPLSVRAASPHDDVDGFVLAHRCGTSYHRPRWLEVIQRAFGHQTLCLVAESGRGIAGVLPLVFFESRLFGTFAVSMPFLNYGGVLAGSPEAERALVERAIEETTRRGGRHLELRHTSQHFTDLTPKRHKVAMRLTLETSVEAQWQALDRKVRNQVRKGEKSGLECFAGGADLLDDFYAVFARNMRDLGTPVYGIEWFREVLRAFPDVSRLFVIRHNGAPVAASFTHRHGETVEVPWASALREANPLCANVLLYWQMLRAAIDGQARVFDFGRSTPAEGTFAFKKGWGAQPQELVWEYWMTPGRSLPDMSPKNGRFQLAIRAWQRLPVPVATALGPYVVRNIP